MFQFLLCADKKMERLSPKKIVGTIKFHSNSNKLFKVMELKVCLMSSEDIIVSSEVDTYR